MTDLVDELRGYVAQCDRAVVEQESGADFCRNALVTIAAQTRPDRAEATARVRSHLAAVEEAVDEAVAARHTAETMLRLAERVNSRLGRHVTSWDQLRRAVTEQEARLIEATLNRATGITSALSQKVVA